MRSVPVAILVSSAFLLAGCSGSGDGDELHYVCPGGTEVHQDDHPSANTTADLAKFCKSSTSGSKSNSTSAAPNVLPTLVLKITDMGGNVTPITLVDGNLTFDATGSTDADGSIAGIAVTVTDSNTTRTATLYDAAKKQFKTATFNFDRPGPVNVTVAMVDDRAGFTVNQTKVYVNHVQTVDVGTISLPAEEAGDGPCSGGDPLTSASYYKPANFALHAGATFVEATARTTGLTSPTGQQAPSGASITICNPVGEAISDSGASVTTTPDVALPAPVGLETYYAGVYATFAQSGVTVDVLVHYEPRPAA